MPLDATRLDVPRRARPPHATASERAAGIAYVELEHAIVRVQVTGSGPFTLVLAPDPPNVIEHHAHLVSLLAAHARVLTFELPGFGFSIPKAGFRFGIDDNANVIAALLADPVCTSPPPLGSQGPRAVLALSCVAGLAALRTAHVHPELVAGIVAVQTPSLEEERRWAARVDRGGLVGTPVVGQALLRAFPARVARGWYRAAFPKGAPRDDVDAHAAIAAAALDRGARFSLASGLQRLRAPAPPLVVDVPALAIWGGSDRTHRRTDKQSIRTLLPRAHIVTFEDVGHFPELEASERFAAEVGAFLRTLP